MTPEQSKKRVTAIEKLQNAFDGKLASLDADLLAFLLEHADTALANPNQLTKLLISWEQKNHVPVLQQFGLDLIVVRELNEAYFAEAVGETIAGKLVNQALFDKVTTAVQATMTEQFGITATGEIVSNGVFDLFSQDTTVRRQIQQFAYSQKSAKVGLDRFKKNLRQFVEGKEDDPNAPKKGIWSRHYDTVAYDVYQQADRTAQQAFSEGLGMTAFLYIGGKVVSSRPFCVVRDGKVFLRSEIEKFGTPQDAYGGYQDKASGYFQGKPKGGYNPFQSLGGYRCRHHLSAITDREAMRRRPDLENDRKGQLVIKD